MVNVIAHEIAHSWTGNLVTNANWEHFWWPPLLLFYPFSFQAERGFHGFLREEDPRADVRRVGETVRERVWMGGTVLSPFPREYQHSGRPGAHGEQSLQPHPRVHEAHPEPPGDRSRRRLQQCPLREGIGPAVHCRAGARRQTEVRGVPEGIHCEILTQDGGDGRLEEHALRVFRLGVGRVEPEDRLGPVAAPAGSPSPSRLRLDPDE